MTESEEMYLVTIARLKEGGSQGYIPLSQLSAELSVLPVSVNQMIRKLEEAGHVCYIPYKGVDLTEEGQRLALQVLRHRRLWEVFLVEQLSILPAEAHALADRMEHIVPMEATERLAAFLGHPVFSPQGEPIPGPQSDLPISAGIALSQLNAGDYAEILQIIDGPAARAFLASEGIIPRVHIHILAIGDRGAVLLETEPGKSVHLSAGIVNNICVIPIENNIKGS